MSPTTDLQPATFDPTDFDVEYFFDPACPFAWQTSVWIRRVHDLRGITIGWRFISLKIVNEGAPTTHAAAYERSHRFLRVCAAARHRYGNDAVAALYRAWGERHWYRDPEIAAATEVDPVDVIADAGQPADLINAADDPGWDPIIKAETDEALRRTGPDVGTPIITYGSGGGSFFGPVISTIPDDEAVLALYDSIRTLAGFPGFSELKRTDRPPLDLPALT